MFCVELSSTKKKKKNMKFKYYGIEISTVKTCNIVSDSNNELLLRKLHFAHASTSTSFIEVRSLASAN